MSESSKIPCIIWVTSVFLRIGKVCICINVQPTQPYHRPLIRCWVQASLKNNPAQRTKMCRQFLQNLNELFKIKLLLQHKQIIIEIPIIHRCDGMFLSY